MQRSGGTTNDDLDIVRGGNRAPEWNTAFSSSIDNNLLNSESFSANQKSNVQDIRRGMHLEDDPSPPV